MDEQTEMAGKQTTKPPFHSFTFTMTDKTIGRRVLRMRYQPDTDDYALHIEAGPAANPEDVFDRTVARSSAQSLLDVLSDIDAFNWESEYGDTTAPGTRRWNTNIVFQENVFSVQSFGGSDVPAGFDKMLEALYQMDLPRPAQPAGQSGFGAAGGMGAGAAGAAGGVPDFTSMFGNFGGPGGPDPYLLEQMQEAMAEMQRNPEAFAEQMRAEFRSLSYDQQNMLLDMLSQGGMGTREWWERFFRG